MTDAQQVSSPHILFKRNSSVKSLAVAVTRELNSCELPGRVTGNIPLVPWLAGVYCPVVSWPSAGSTFSECR